MNAMRALRQRVRRLARTPTFTLVAIGTLALGIGATSAMYAVIDGVLLEPLPYPAADRLVGLWHEAPGLDFEEVNQSPSLHLTYRDENRVFDGVAMWSRTRVTVTGLAEPEEVPGIMTTAGGLELLGARPVLGRTFTDDDDRPDANRTALIGWGYWQQRFGGARDVIGRSIQMNGRATEIIGVLPRDFRFIEHDAGIVLPMRIDPSTVSLGNFSYFGVARLREGATIAQANADVARMIPIAGERFERPDGLTFAMMQEARFGPNVRPLSREILGDVANVLWVLLGTVAIVLLIACANVANLFLVRAESRYREIAVRKALGASRREVALEFFWDSMLLAAAGGIAGAGLGYAGVRLLHRLSPEGLPRLHSIALDGSVLLVIAALTMAAGIFLAIAPAAKQARQTLASVLREGGRGGSAGRERHRMRSALVVSQLALALVLLAGSGLMFRTVLALGQVDPGFDRAADVLTLRLSIPSAEVPEPEQAALMHERILRAVLDVSGVAAVGLSSAVPMDGRTSGDPLYAEGHFVPDNTLPPIRRYKWISPGYLDAQGTRLLAGRDYTWDDVRGARPVAIIAANLAREYWGDPAAALGKRVRNMPNGTWREVIGVAEDTRDDGVERDPPAVVYWPMLMADLWEPGLMTQRSLSYVMRLDRPFTPALMDGVRQAVWSVNSNLPLAEVRTLDAIVAQSMARTSFTLVMLAIAAAVSLLLGGVGLYGVISYIVSQRTREFGVRMALGARSGDVGRMVLREATLLVLVGLAIGLAAAIALTRLMSALLFGVSAIDPLTFGAVALVLGSVALLAAWLPARRAASADPIQALRWE